jgi:hypothetical protein
MKVFWAPFPSHLSEGGQEEERKSRGRKGPSNKLSLVASTWFIKAASLTKGLVHVNPALGLISSLSIKKDLMHQVKCKPLKHYR